MIHLDSNAVIHGLKGDAGVRGRLLAAGPGWVAVSAIAVAELRTGALRGDMRWRNSLEALLAELEIVPFDASASIAAARIRHALEAKGQGIGPLDTLIAASALDRNAVLVTNNLREFGRVEGLRLEDWRTAG